MQKDTETAECIRNCLEDGKLIPSQITVSLLKRKIQDIKGYQKLILIDGFPRNLENVEEWDRQCSDIIKITKMIYIDVSEKTMHSRILSRAKIENREFDTEKLAEKRIESFNDETYPVIKQFMEKRMVAEVDGENSLDEVLDEMTKAIGLT